MKALSRYEAGESLLSLQKAYPEISHELSEMVHALLFITKHKKDIRPDADLARRIIKTICQGSVTADQPSRYSTTEDVPQRLSLRASVIQNMWKIGAGLGIAVFAFFMVITAIQSPAAPETAIESAAFATRMASPAEGGQASADMTAADEIDAATADIESTPIEDGSESDAELIAATDESSLNEFDAAMSESEF